MNQRCSGDSCGLLVRRDGVCQHFQRQLDFQWILQHVQAGKTDILSFNIIDPQKNILDGTCYKTFTRHQTCFMGLFLLPQVAVRHRWDLPSDCADCFPNHSHTFVKPGETEARLQFPIFSWWICCSSPVWNGFPGEIARTCPFHP